jgi:acetyl-CoA C-acetyltransferase
MNPKTPIIVAASQFTQRFDAQKMPLEPIKMAEQCIRETIKDTQNDKILNEIDALFVVNIFGYKYADAPQMLAEKLEINPKIKYYSPLGGNNPQYLVNKSADLLVKGKINFAIITGAEANYSYAKALKSGIKLDWTPPQNPRNPDEENKLGTSNIENDYELFLLSNAYPIIETALRAENQRTITEHQRHIGNLYAKLSEIAAQHPNAWTKEKYTQEQIIESNENNRIVAFPYLKRMCANNQTDQAAALLLTTIENAIKYQIPEEKWVFLSAGANLNDSWYFTQREKITESPALKHLAQVCLQNAQLDLSEIDAFDLYSCFPSAVQVAQKALDLKENDVRPISLTGGLSYFGGPWNNYTMHAIATAVQKIQNNIFKNVFINSLGWYITKHSVGIYTKNYPKNLFHLPDLNQKQQEIDNTQLPDLLKEYNGKAKIIGYSVLLDFKNEPYKAIVLLENNQNQRLLAYWQDENIRTSMQEEFVGKEVNVYFDEKKKRNFISF